MKNTKVNLKKGTAQRNIVSDWHCAVVYHDRERARDVVPACNIDNWTPPEFVQDKVYKIFWSPTKETLPDFKKRVKRVPTFEDGSSNSTAGFYNGCILRVAGSEIELDMSLASDRVSVPSEKAIAKATGSSCADSGVSNVSSNARKRNCDGSSTASKRSKPNSEPKQQRLFVNERAEDIGSDSEGEDPTMIPLSQHKEAIHSLRKKYDRSKETVKRQEIQIAALHDMYEQLLKDATAGKFSRACTCSTAAQSIVSIPPAAARPSAVLGTSRPTSAPVRPPAAPVCPPSAPVRPPAAPVCPPSAPVRPPAAPAPAPAVASTAAPTAVVAVQDLPPTEATELLDDQSNLPPQGENNVQAVEENVADPNNTQDAVEIYPTVSIDRRAYVPEFKKFLESQKIGYGSKNDRDFVYAAARAMWGDAVLRVHSVSGKPTNCKLKADPNAKANPALEDFKINAILEALRARVLREESSLPPQGVEPETKTFKERVTPSLVRKHIGREIFNAQRRKVPGPAVS